jgi:hypothetical protein
MEIRPDFPGLVFVDAALIVGGLSQLLNEGSKSWTMFFLRVSYSHFRRMADFYASAC